MPVTQTQEILRDAFAKPHGLGTFDVVNDLTMSAVLAAGRKCVLTVSSHARKQDFSDPVLVLTCLGDPDDELCDVVANPSRGTPVRWLVMTGLESVLAGP